MLWSLVLLPSLTASMATTSAATLFLRHGGQLSTETPSMAVINGEEMSAAMALHATTQYFHSDFAHTDYAAAPAAGNASAAASAGASWSSPPLRAKCTLSSGPVRTTLWIGTNAGETAFTVALSRWSERGGWASLCGGSASTAQRDVGADGTAAAAAARLPGKPMVAASSNGGFAVAVPVEMALEEPVVLAAGDRLRIDVSCAAAAGSAAADAEEQGDQERGGPGAGGPEGWTWQRIWHNQKWASTVEIAALGGEPLSLHFEAHPVITQWTI